jgi:hypothetical protein
MNATQRGVVINVNAYGATVRLEDGQLASAPAADVEKHRAQYDRGLLTRKPLEFQVQPGGRHMLAMLAPQLRDEEFEQQIANYLKSTQEWENPELAPAHERHFLRKKRRAAIFESRHATDR